MNGNTNGLWRFRKDEEGQFSIYDQQGFVAAVDDLLTAERLVETHHLALQTLEDILMHEQWGCDTNFMMWQMAQREVAELKAAIMAALDMLDSALAGCGAEEARALLEAVLAD